MHERIDVSTFQELYFIFLKIEEFYEYRGKERCYLLYAYFVKPLGHLYKIHFVTFGAQVFSYGYDTWQTDVRRDYLICIGHDESKKLHSLY